MGHTFPIRILQKPVIRQLHSKSFYQQLENKFKRSFPLKESLNYRKIGREAEYPVVWEDGNAADIRLLLEQIQKENPKTFIFEEEKGFERLLSKSDTTQVSGLIAKDLGSLSLEVGWGTIEVILDPENNLKDLQLAHERIMERVLHAADSIGMKLLGYGIQPRTPPSLDLMSPRNRYKQMYTALGDPWLGFAATASDQIHVDVALEEVIEITNLCNLLCPIVIALCGNSPIYGGIESGVCSSREGLMQTIQQENRRHGMPLFPFQSIEQYFQCVNSHDFLAHPKRNNMNNEWEVISPRVSFEKYMLTHEKMNWEDFYSHERYIWHSARPRMKQGTIELRSACQQPWKEHTASSVLQFALVEASTPILEYIHQVFDKDYNQAWKELSKWHDLSISYGLNLNAYERKTSLNPLGFIRDLLDICSTVLEKRGFREDVYLQQMYKRLEAFENPAQKCIKIGQEGGMSALLKHITIS